MSNFTRRYVDLYDDKVVSVKLGRKGDKGIAGMYEKDFDFLMELGLSPNWNMTNGSVTAPACMAKGRNVGVARVLMDVGEGYTVKFRDGNKCNLRRDNLEVHFGGFSTRRDRDFLTPVEVRRRPTLASNRILEVV